MKAYYQYINTVAGNENTDFELAAKKMTRNAALSKIIERNDGSFYCQYGKLHFIVFNDTIVWLRNQCPTPKGWSRNKRFYLELNELYGINEGVTMWDLIKKDIEMAYWRRVGKAKWALKSLVD